MRLGLWAHAQRSLRKQGRLGEDKVGRLASLGFAWDASDSQGKGQSWSDSLALLEEYASSHPDWDGQIPQKHRTEGGYELGRWAHGQRAIRKRGRLSEDKVGRLDRLGFAWSTWAKQDRGGYLALLEEYAAARGGPGRWDGQITHTYRTDGGAELGRWAHSQRAAKRKGKNISRERIEALERLGFAWEDPSYRRGKVAREKPRDAVGGDQDGGREKTEKIEKKAATGDKTKRKRRKGGDSAAPASAKRRRKSAGSKEQSTRPSGSANVAGTVPVGGQSAPSAVVDPPANSPGPSEGLGAELGPVDEHDATARNPSEPEVDEMMEEVYAALTAAV